MDVRARARGLWSGTSGRPILRIAIVLIVIALLAGVAWLAYALVHQSAAGGGAGGGRRGGRPSTTVGVATATLADVPITVDGLGTVRPAATVTVTPQVSGVITRILFQEGQTVRAGQPLAIIDPRPLQMQLMQAQGQLARDEAQLAGAEVLLGRQRTLLGQDSIARQDVDTQYALVRQLQGAIIGDRATVGAARLNLGFSTVTAPVSGRVGLRVVDVGNFVATGASGGIVVITQVMPIDVEFTVPQDAAPNIQMQASQGALPVTAFDRTATTPLDQGVFSTLDNQIDTTTGTVRAKARFPNAEGHLFPNQFVNVRVNLQTLHNVVVVPVTAVRTGANGDFVWVLQTDHTVSLRLVTKGPSTSTMISLTRGLMAGERVITEGGDRLTDGARVQLPGENPVAGGAGGRRGGHHRRNRGGAAGQGGAQQGGGGQSGGGGGGGGGGPGG